LWIALLPLPSGERVGVRGNGTTRHQSNNARCRNPTSSHPRWNSILAIIAQLLQIFRLHVLGNVRLFRLALILATILVSAFVWLVHGSPLRSHALPRSARPRH